MNRYRSITSSPSARSAFINATGISVPSRWYLPLTWPLSCTIGLAIRGPFLSSGHRNRLSSALILEQVVQTGYCVLYGTFGYGARIWHYGAAVELVAGMQIRNGRVD